MKQNQGKRIAILFITTILMLSTSTTILSATTLTGPQHFDPLSRIPIPRQLHPTDPLYIEDYDPNVDIHLTVKILHIRSLEKNDNHVNSDKRIDRYTDPDFYVKVFINDQQFQSPVWRNTKYLYDINWEATVDVPDDQEWVNITIQLWDWNIGLDKKCDINSLNQNTLFDTKIAYVYYSLKTGHWYGDDLVNNMAWWKDYSGYGRLNGCDDGSIYEKNDRDCELWFDIYQTDLDGDRIPYWSEVTVYHTDPLKDDTGTDLDNDGIPIEWEHKWGHYFTWDWHNQTLDHAWLFSDLIWDDHAAYDFDHDGLTNIEEYLTSCWDSDPYRKDLFVELDEMAPSPDGFENKLPEGAKELLRTVFNRRNIVYHLDDGSMGGSETIPFMPLVDREILGDVYWNYFLHQDPDNGRKRVFHYGLVVYRADYHGYCFRSNAWQISAYTLEKNKTIPKTTVKRDIVFGSAYMHECGHTFGFSPIGGHDDKSKYPWQLGWWKWRTYISCMNYGYMYTMIDYSDGSRGKNDFNDWSQDRMDLTYFLQDDW